jgi:hypothetical protein
MQEEGQPVSTFDTVQKKQHRNSRYKERISIAKEDFRNGTAEVKITDSGMTNNTFSASTPIDAIRNQTMVPHYNDLEHFSSPKFASPRQSPTSILRPQKQGKRSPNKLNKSNFLNNVRSASINPT